MAKAYYINGPKRRKRSKKRRSAKQIRAFKKMRAGLKAYLAGKSGKKRKRRKSRKSKTHRKVRARKARRSAAQKRAAKRNLRKARAARRGHKKGYRKMKARRAKHRRKSHGRRKGRRIRFKRVRAKLYRRNPSGMLSAALGLVKSAGPGAVGAAVIDLWGVEPLMAHFSVPRAVQPVVKVIAGLGLCAIVDRFAPKYRRHAETAAIGLMSIAAKDAIGRLAGHPLSKMQDAADAYSGLNELVPVPSLGLLTTGTIDQSTDAAIEGAFAGWPEVYVNR